MKRFFQPLALAALMLGVLAMGSLTSCKKDPNAEFNPPVDDSLVAAPFTLKGTEKRSDGGYVLTWDITKTTVDCVQEELNKLAITPFNTFTFEAVPESASATFPGINAKTDNGCIKLERKGQSSFSISYVSDGDATIKVWNGNEGGNTAVTFRVKARKTIPVEGLLVRIDGKEDVLIKAVGSHKSVIYEQQKENPFYTVKYLPHKEGSQTDDDGKLDGLYRPYTREELDLHKLEILHVQPENTTIRRLNYSHISLGDAGTVSYMFCEGEFEWFDRVKNGGNYNLPDGTDISILYGKSIFFGSVPYVKPGNVITWLCPPGFYYLMETAVAPGSDSSDARNIWGLANSVKVVE